MKKELRSVRARLACRFAVLVALLVFSLAAVQTLAQPLQLDPNSLSQLQQRGQNSGVSNTDQQLQSMTLQPAVPLAATNQPASRLEQIMSARGGVKLTQFGYDQLGTGRAVTIPMSGAVQDDYMLGPGDEIVISLRGQENSEFRVLVDRNGQVVLPRLSPVSAMGRSFGSFRQDIENAVRRAYVATNAFVSVGRVRQITVQVAGEVNNAGPRLVTGLSSAVDALVLSGGVKKTGSLRNIRIQRAGHDYTVDLYGLLTNRGSADIMRLADGDRIIVPPLGRIAAVAGLVRRPGIYELAPRQTSIAVRGLLDLAGGTEVRGRYRMAVLRIGTDGGSTMTPLAGEAGTVQDSEILSVQIGADRTSAQATLSGDTGLAGTYAVTTGTHLSEILKAPGALGTTPYTPFGLLVRRNPATMLRSLVAFTPMAVLAGREGMVLQGDDFVRVLSVDEARLLTFDVRTYQAGLAVQQNVIRNPLGQGQGDTSVAQLVSAQSGQTVEISDVASVPADVQRQQVLSLLSTPAPGSPLAQRQAEEARAQQRASQQASLAQELSNRNNNGIPLQAPTGPMTAPGMTQGQPSAFGSQPGLNPQAPASQISSNSDINDNFGTARNFTEQQVDDNRIASNREVQTFGQLARQLGVDPLVLMNFLVDNRVRLDGAVRGPGYYFAGPSATLSDVIEAAGGTANWADESGVELITTAVDRQSGRSVTRRQTLALHEGTLDKYVLRSHDEIHFNPVTTDVGAGSVTVQGEVRLAGSFPILRGEHLSDLLARAGGLTSTAYPAGTVFLRQSVAQKEHEGFLRAANEVQDQLVIAMTRVGNGKIDPGTFASMQVFVNELRNQRSVGRISIAADPSVLASNPALDPLLEPGDVIYVPQRPSTISVLGQVKQPGSYPYRPGESVASYIARAGGYAKTADSSETFLVLPDGSARQIERSWLSFSENNLPPGSAVVVPRDVTPLDLRQVIIDVSQVFSQFAVSIASVAVLAKQ